MGIQCTGNIKENQKTGKEKAPAGAQVVGSEVTMDEDGTILTIGGSAVDRMSYPVQVSAEILGACIKMVMNYEQDPGNQADGVYPTRMTELFDEIRDDAVGQYREYMIAVLVEFLNLLPPLDRMIEQMRDGRTPEEE